MFTRYHDPLGDASKKQDPLPENWPERSENAPDLPKNLGVVVEGNLYRSAIIWPSQIHNLQEKYQIKHVVSLVYGDWLREFYSSPDIHIHQFPFYQRKELTSQRVDGIVEKILSLDGPVIVHCLKGAVRTGQVCFGYKTRIEGHGRFSSVLNSIKHGNANLSSLKGMFLES